MITTFIPIALIIVTAVTGQQSVCKSLLQWVPGYRKEVFTAFLNHVDCPTWTTRYAFSKDTTEYSTLLLPKGVPFAFLCGACFSPGGSLEANLTAEIHNGQSLKLVPVRRNKKNFQHTKDDNTVCLISYGITAPLSKGGKITCTLNRGDRKFEEKLSFGVQKSVIKEDEEEPKEVTSNGVVRLQCPEDKSIGKNVHVWYSIGGEETPESEIPFLVANLNPEIDFRPKVKEHHIACAVYDVKNPSVVQLKRYKVLTTAEEIKSGQWATDNQESETQTSGSGASKRGILIVVGLLVAGICLATIIVCASFGFCKFNRKRKDEPQAQHEANRLSLLHSPIYNNEKYNGQ